MTKEEAQSIAKYLHDTEEKCKENNLPLPENLTHLREYLNSSAMLGGTAEELLELCQKLALENDDDTSAV